MSTPETPQEDKPTQGSADRDAHDDDTTGPPTYPAYSTPPSKGLPDAEHD